MLEARSPKKSGAHLSEKKGTHQARFGGELGQAQWCRPPRRIAFRLFLSAGSEVLDPDHERERHAPIAGLFNSVYPLAG